MGSTSELWSGIHQKGCDLEGVEGATPQHNSHTHFKTMTEQNIQDQAFDLSDEQLADVAAGSFKDWYIENVVPWLPNPHPFMP